MLITILAAIMAILVVVLIHECGHFWVARAVGIRVLKFSIGFGKPLWKRTSKAGTEYALSMIPLGGYVKMLGDDTAPISEQDKPYAYNFKPVWARMAVVAAGPLINFLLAILLFWFIFLQGSVLVKPVVGSVIAKTPAALAGFKAGDEVVAIGGKTVEGWSPVMLALIEASHSKPMKIQVKTSSGQLETRILNLAKWEPDTSNPNLLDSVGLEVYMPKMAPDLAAISANSPAQKAGLQVNDRITALNGKTYEQWLPLVKAIRLLPDHKVTLTVLRDKKTLQIPVHLSKQVVLGKTQGFLGAMVKEVPLPDSMLVKRDYTVWQSLNKSVHKTYDLIRLNIVVLGKIFTGQLSVKVLGGPITVFQGAGHASHYGWLTYLGFVAFINIALGFVNLLPIPGLDGGHLLFLLAEAIRRKPLSEQVQSVGIRLGFTALIMIMLLATYNDLIRLFFSAH